MVDLSSVLIIKALDGLEARTAVAAENIANSGTAGYRPRQISFEASLAQAAIKGVDAVQATRPTMIQSGLADSGVRLDMEMSTASATAARYSALVEILNRQMQIHALALTGGR